jgi:acetyltransferase
MGGSEIEVGEEILNHAGIPTFKYPDTAARAFALMWRYADNLRALYETPALDVTPASPPELAAGVPVRSAASGAMARTIINHVRSTARTILTEFESKQLLAAYGIPTVETHVARSEDEAVHLAEKLGFAVVLKLWSETITHKTDVGGVQLNIRNVAGVRQAWQAIEKSCREKAGPQHFLGVTVSRWSSSRMPTKSSSAARSIRNSGQCCSSARADNSSKSSRTGPLACRR